MNYGCSDDHFFINWELDALKEYCLRILNFDLQYGNTQRQNYLAADKI
jgi:hypothetical protein